MKTDDIKHKTQEALAALKTLRDEVRLEIHLAGMEARTRFGEVDKLAQEMEVKAHEATEATRKVVEELAAKLREIKESIQRGKSNGTGTHA